MKNQVCVITSILFITLLSGCNTVKETSAEPEAQVSMSEIRIIQKSEIKNNSNVETNSQTITACSELKSKPGSDLEKLERTITADLRNLGKTDLETENYLRKWRCDNRQLFH